MSDRYVVISSDGHCGPAIPDYRPYLERRYHDDFDAWAATFTGRFGDFTDDDAADRQWNHDRRLAETEADGVVAEVLFPNTHPPFDDMGPLSSPPPDAAQYEFRRAGLRAYNRWLAEFCAAAPGRRAGIALVLLNDPEAAVEEIRWAHDAGLNGGVLLPGIPPGTAFPPLYSPVYEPIWATCAELGMPLNHHPDSAAPPLVPDQVSLATHVIEVRWFMHRALWHLMFAGVFERHPELTLVLTEQGADWIPGVLSTLEYYWERFQFSASLEANFGGSALKELRRSPSEYWARNCMVGATFMRPSEAAQRHEIGVDRIMWGQDYPHHESTYPHSKEALRHSFHGVEPAEVQPILAGNACRVYGFDMDKLRTVADRVGPLVSEVLRRLDKIPDGATSPVFAAQGRPRAW
jgi:predicted TIM-barrel fold metal-dependent hydrolase